MSKKKSSKKSIKKLHLDKPTSHGGWPNGHSGSYRDPNTPVNKQISKFLSDMGLLDDDNPRARLSEDKIRVKRIVLEGLLKQILTESIWNSQDRQHLLDNIVVNVKDKNQDFFNLVIDSLYTLVDPAKSQNLNFNISKRYLDYWYDSLSNTSKGNFFENLTLALMLKFGIKIFNTNRFSTGTGTSNNTSLVDFSSVDEATLIQTILSQIGNNIIDLTNIDFYQVKGSASYVKDKSVNTRINYYSDKGTNLLRKFINIILPNIITNQTIKANLTIVDIRTIIAQSPLIEIDFNLEDKGIKEVINILLTRYSSILSSSKFSVVKEVDSEFTSIANKVNEISINLEDYLLNITEHFESLSSLCDQLIKKNGGVDSLINDLKKSTTKLNKILKEEEVIDNEKERKITEIKNEYNQLIKDFYNKNGLTNTLINQKLDDKGFSNRVKMFRSIAITALRYGIIELEENNIANKLKDLEEVVKNFKSKIKNLNFNLNKRIKEKVEIENSNNFANINDKNLVKGDKEQHPSMRVRTSKRTNEKSLEIYYVRMHIDSGKIDNLPSLKLIKEFYKEISGYSKLTDPIDIPKSFANEFKRYAGFDPNNNTSLLNNIQGIISIKDKISPISASTLKNIKSLESETELFYLDFIKNLKEVFYQQNYIYKTNPSKQKIDTKSLFVQPTIDKMLSSKNYNISKGSDLYNIIIERINSFMNQKGLDSSYSSIVKKATGIRDIGFNLNPVTEFNKYQVSLVDKDTTIDLTDLSDPNATVITLDKSKNNYQGKKKNAKTTNYGMDSDRIELFYIPYFKNEILRRVSPNSISSRSSLSAIDRVESELRFQGRHSEKAGKITINNKEISLELISDMIARLAYFKPGYHVDLTTDLLKANISGKKQYLINFIRNILIKDSSLMKSKKINMLSQVSALKMQNDLEDILNVILEYARQLSAIEVKRVVTPPSKPTINISIDSELEAFYHRIVFREILISLKFFEYFKPIIDFTKLNIKGMNQQEAIDLLREELNNSIQTEDKTKEFILVLITIFLVFVDIPELDVYREKYKDFIDLDNLKKLDVRNLNLDTEKIESQESYKEPEENEQDKDEILGLIPQDNNETDDLPNVEDEEGIIDITALRRQQDDTEEEDEDEDEKMVAESKLYRMVLKDLFEHLNR